MKPALKYTLIAIVIFMLLLAVWQGYKLLKNPAAPGGNTNKKTPGGGSAGSTNTSKFPLKLGSSGQEVTNLQNYLNWAGSYGLTVDGQFGSNTQSAVQQELSQPGGVPVTTVSLAYYNQYVVPYVNGTTITQENNGVTVTDSTDASGDNGSVLPWYDYLDPFILVAKI